MLETAQREVGKGYERSCFIILGFFLFCKISEQFGLDEFCISLNSRWTVFPGNFNIKGILGLSSNLLVAV